MQKTDLIKPIKDANYYSLNNEYMIKIRFGIFKEN